MPLQQSNLITRKQLNCLSGGSKSKSKSKSTSTKYGNPLKLGTPFSYCGGRAFALSQGRIHHVCIKEKCNRPLPESSNEPLIIYRIAKNGRIMDLPTDIENLANTVENAIRGSLDTIIPIFWEPINQLGKSPTISGTGVTYVGHWRAVEVKQQLLSTNFVYLGQKRCARITFEFDRYDQRTSTIINQSYDKTCEEIDTMSFDGADSSSSSSSSNAYYKEEQRKVNDEEIKDKERVSSYAAGRYPNKPKEEENESDDDDDDDSSDDDYDDDSDNGNLKRRASRNKKRSINQVKEETSSGSRKVAARQCLPRPSTRNSNHQYKREIKNENHRKNEHEDLQHLASSSSSCSPYKIFQIDLLLQQQQQQQQQHHQSQESTAATAAASVGQLRPFIRVQNKPYISFGELRTAIDQQLDLKEPHRNSNFHFCIDGLDLSTRQEEWNVYDFVFNTTKCKVAEGEGTAAEPIDIDGDDSDHDDDDGKAEEGSASELGTTTSNPFRIAIKPPRRVI